MECGDWVRMTFCYIPFLILAVCLFIHLYVRE